MALQQGQLSPLAQQQTLRYAQMPQIVPGMGVAPASMVAGVPPMMAAQYGYAQLLHGAGTRKNATRESTAPLKSWLKDHQKNPYPTKGEKIMLALVSGMTLTQVSTWFANARRRLKKENKWSPDAGFEDDEESTKIVTECTRAEESGYSSHNDGSSDHHSEHSSPRSDTITPPPQSIQSRNIIRLPTISSGTPVIAKGPALVRAVSSDRPKIWSLAEMSSSSSNSGSTHDHSDSEMNPIQVS